MRDFKTNPRDVALQSLYTLKFDAAAEFVKPEDMYEYVRILDQLEQHIEWLQKYMELGFSELYLHNVNREQQAFIEVFGEKVLPALAGD